ncbi:hypothetical protein C5167_014744 [Papaver somniferum]|uniref:Uncharacterized protein n=1 Tax=Papaver somniferum TaxID=3469 RepID=A0A4Y7J8F4_PAPSO|nr:hypothetical protein C5167_014744 [Papaver somniferum]
MAKISMFLGFFLFVLIAMPNSSSSRMMLGVSVGPVDVEVGTTKSCPAEDCSQISGCPPTGGDCPPLVCTNGVRQTCCDCGEECCPV